jgi:hypothetical protein
MWELWQPLPVTWVVDIAAVFELRQQAARCHELAHRYCDYAAATGHLAGFRGLYLDGSGQAEAFLEVEPATAAALVDRLLGLRADQERSISGAA